MVPADKPALIYLPKEVSLKQAKVQLNLKEMKGNYLCIDHPDDFARYWETFAVQEGKRMRVAGPLQEIFKRGRKIIY